MSQISVHDDHVTLDYDLLELPTAQHKAGLAGLLVMIESLRRRKIEPLPLVSVSTGTVRVTFTEKSLGTVMDDLFDARWRETLVRQKWAGKTPKRVEEITVETDGKTKTEKRFVYDIVQPAGAFLQTFYADGDGVWTALWRTMVWTILRGIPKTRTVYNERADGKPSAETGRVWNNLRKAAKNRAKNQILTEKLTSSLFIGAEADNPERVPFVGAVEDNLLLHFWPLVSLIFVPRELQVKRKEETIQINRNTELGYVLAIPEPADLEGFKEDVIGLLRGLDPTKSGYRPRDARIDIFEESGLEYLHHFARNKTESKDDFVFSLHAVELYHIHKQGNRIRQLAADRILPRPDVITEYEQVRDGLSNPFFKMIHLRNILTGVPWYTGADAVFRFQPMPIFVRCARTPRDVRFFGRDVRHKLSTIAKTIETKKGANLMTERDHEDQLALLVHRLIQQYIRRRTEEKSGKKFEAFKKNKDENNRINYPREYREALEKVATDAFLAMRGRRDQDFVEYFTGTICSVPQFLPREDYLTVANKLMDDWQTIKTLSMLAISASSYISQPSTKKEG